jgi:signal transduction histidine kinase
MMRTGSSADGQFDLTAEASREAAAALDRLARLVDESTPGPVVSREIRELRRERALSVLAGDGYGDAAATLAVLGFAADLFAAAAVDLAVQPRHAERLIEEIERTAGIGRVALGREVLRAPQLAELPTDVALEVQLALILAFAQVGAVSLSTISPSGEIDHVARCGELAVEPGDADRLTRTLLHGGDPHLGHLTSDAGIPVRHWRGSPAALIAHGPPLGQDHRQVLLEAAAPLLGTILERKQGIGQRPPDQGVLMAVRRRLARLRFDLHDGPQQDVHLLASDLQLFRDRLSPIIAKDPDADRVLGRLDDLAAQLVALDDDLRRLAAAVESPLPHAPSVADALRELTDAFTSRSGLRPKLRLSGDLSVVTESQQLTLLALVREALSNIRQHSDADNVTVTLASKIGGIEAEVSDDGCGFDPETVLVQAARDGHLGLVGMHERVRMLGGHTNVESRPGGPTVVSVSLPPSRQPR